MTTRPPRHVPDLMRRGVRLLATSVVALIVVAITALGNGGATWPLAGAAAFAAGAVVLHLRSEQLSALATSAAVVALALLVVGARALLTPAGSDLDLFLWVAGGLFLASGVLLDERRLVSLGLIQWAIVLVRPAEDSVAFRHCLFATDLAIPVPTLDGVLVVGLGALLVGSLARFGGWRLEAGRGAEITGLVMLETVLVAKATELPDLPVLCGAGRGVDPGWLLLAMGVGVLAGLYGAAGRDPVWTGVGAGGTALAGLVGTALSGEASWALIALVPLLATLIAAERLGISWPRGAGYGRRRPWERS